MHQAVTLTSLKWGHVGSNPARCTNFGGFMITRLWEWLTVVFNTDDPIDVFGSITLCALFGLISTLLITASLIVIISFVIWLLPG